MNHPMTGFDEQWQTPEQYILGITKQIWEDRGVDKLNHLYTSDIPVRFPGGSSVGNQQVIDSTWATLAEFPDRQLLGEDVIWSDDGEGGFLSSHRIISTATHTGDGAFGKATGAAMTFRTIADCAARENAIYDEWLVRDLGAMVRAVGSTPQEFAARDLSGAAPLTPDTMPPAIYTGRGNDHEAGRRYVAMLQRVAAGNHDQIQTDWDRAVQLETPSNTTSFGWAGVQSLWGELRTALPDAELSIEHQIGHSDSALGDRASARWWFSGTHTGDGIFGEPSGATLHIMGISHGEFGPWGLRREWVVFDEVAVWKQILLASR